MKHKTPELTPEMVADHLAALDPQAVEQLAPFWRHADILPAYPADTETVAELMDANGYRCDRDTILRMIADNAVPSPDRKDGRLVWRAIDIRMLVTACEMRRRWKPFSKFHSHKLTQFEKLQELASLNGGKSCFSDLMFFDWPGLIAMLHEPGMAELGARQALAAALTEKLRELGVDI